MNSYQETSTIDIIVFLCFNSHYNKYNKQNHLLLHLMSHNYTKKLIAEYMFYTNNKIGEGAYSQVFKGNHKKTGQDVAIKMISLDRTIKGNDFKYVEMEISTLYKLKNTPNNIEIKSVVQTKNNIYLITQFCQHGNLRHLIKKQRKFSQKKSTDLVQQIIEGYRSITSAGIIHRDLKPDNIFAQNAQIKIGDFGFSINADLCDRPLSQNIGSPLYMAPEALISSLYSYQSDIWAIGLIFFEMLTGSTPWKSKTQIQLKSELIVFKIQQCLPPKINAKSKEFLIKTLQTQRSKRMSLKQLLEFNFNDSQLQNTNGQYSFQQGKSNYGDKSTVAEAIKLEVNRHQLMKQSNSMVHTLESNKSVPNLNINKAKRLQTKKTISFQNEYKQKVNTQNNDKLLNDIEKHPLEAYQIKKQVTHSQNTIQNLNVNQQKIVSQQVLGKESADDRQKKEDFPIRKDSSIKKFIHKSFSIVFQQEKNTSSHSIFPSISSFCLAELPEYCQNEEEDDQANTFQKQNELNEGKSSSQDEKDSIKKPVIQSIYIQVKHQAHSQEQTLQTKHPFAAEIQQIKSQIFYFTLLNQIIKNMSTYLKTSNEKVDLFKRNLIFLAFQQLESLKSLKSLRLSNKERQIFRATREFAFFNNLVSHYQQKYQKKYSKIRPAFKSHKEFIGTLSCVLQLVHQNTAKYQKSEEEMNSKKMIFVILDSLVDFSNLYFVNKEQNWAKFHLKSHPYEKASKSEPISIKQYAQNINKKYLLLNQI